MHICKCTESELLTSRQAAEILGIKESRIRSAIFRNEIDYHKIGRLVRISRQEIKEWLKRGLVRSSGEGPKIEMAIQRELTGKVSNYPAKNIMTMNLNVRK